jgi:hypothetical protein
LARAHSLLPELSTRTAVGHFFPHSAKSSKFQVPSSKVGNVLTCVSGVAHRVRDAAHHAAASCAQEPSSSARCCNGRLLRLHGSVISGGARTECRSHRRSHAVFFGCLLHPADLIDCVLYQMPLFALLDPISARPGPSAKRTRLMRLIRSGSWPLRCVRLLCLHR